MSRREQRKFYGRGLTKLLALHYPLVYVAEGERRYKY